MSNLYDMSSYTNTQLYEILDLDNPSDRELEAKILMMIHKYETMKNKSGTKLSQFFEKIYNHFFEDSDEEEEDEDIFEGFTGEEATARENASELYQTSTDATSKKNISYADGQNPTDVSLNDLKITGQNLDNLAMMSTRQSGAATSTEYQGADKDATKEVIYTTPLPYTRGTLNPILKQTTKRIISIDSQYRPDKTSGSTEFTCNLSEPLKDVVSLKLYSIQIPFTWYTIGKSYGSNFFYFKGRTEGIDNENHDIQISILAGNYKPQELVTTVNLAIQTTNDTIDANIEDSVFVYNSNTSLCNFTANIKKQFNQSSYYLSLPKWSSPYLIAASRNTTISSYLGFQTDQYYVNTLKSPLYNSFQNVNITNTDTYMLTAENNYMKLIQYIGTSTYDETASTINKTTDISFSLIVGASYTRSQLISNLNTQISNNTNLTNSYIHQVNIDSKNVEASTVSQIELKLNYNRLSIDPNIDDSKMVVLFPSDDTVLWTGTNSCFRFDASENELNIIYSDVSPISQNDRYVITNNPYIELICIAENFENSVNDLSFNVADSVGTGYNITEYAAAINTGMRTYDTSYNISNGYNVLNTPASNYVFDPTIYTYPTGSFAYIKDTTFNIFLDINKKFDRTMYEIDLSGGVFETIVKLIKDDTGSPIIYYSVLTDLTQTYTSKLSIASREISPTDTICIIKPKTGGNNGNESDVNYTLTFESVLTETGFYSYPQIESFINTVFNNYIDPINNLNIFQGTILTSSVENNLYEINFNITINKLLIAKNYKIRFIDNDNDSWSDNLFIDTLMTDSYYDMSFNVPIDTSTKNYNSGTVIQISEINTNGDILITANAQIAQSNPLTIQSGVNDTIIFKAYEDGLVTTTGSNDITLTIPDGTYTTDYLVQTINEKIAEHSGIVKINTTLKVLERSNGQNYIKIENNIVRTYTATDYNLVFYDRISFSQCFTGTKSIQNTTWDTTVGWILGFREYTEYDLSADEFNLNSITTFFGDTGISTSLFNYFLLCLDDYNQNRLNDGLVTITGTDTGVKLPSYAQRSELQCDPVSGELVYNNTTGLTGNQIYAVNQLANANATNTAIGSSVSTKSYGTGPFVTDVFGLIPVKTNGLLNGAPYVEFGGTLQNQERSYFGPVNISRLSVRLVTDRGNNVDLNNANWSFSLVCEQLNKLEPS
jgi:hypothetical protein